jgi:hypothetical protein
MFESRLLVAVQNEGWYVNFVGSCALPAVEYWACGPDWFFIRPRYILAFTIPLLRSYPTRSAVVVGNRLVVTRIHHNRLFYKAVTLGTLISLLTYCKRISQSRRHIFTTHIDPNGNILGAHRSIVLKYIY